MFKREIREAPLDGGENPPVKMTVTYTGENCPDRGQQSRAKQHELLRSVVDNPGLLDCGLHSFQKLNMSHNGFAWVIVLEAVIQR